MRNKLSVSLPAGYYTVAVSGGVDSMVLLDLIAKQKGAKLTVAHFDHGIRPDSRLDRLLTQAIAARHKLPFVYAEAKLGPDVSEATARKHRYDFLYKVKRASNSAAIITAHHQDDQLETAIFNLMRGTGRKGLSSLQSNKLVLRPLLSYRKQDLYDYAASHNLLWREDSTNQDGKYARNYIRNRIIPNFSRLDQQKLLNLINQTAELNQAIDAGIDDFVRINSNLSGFSRTKFINLPHIVANEVMASWLRLNNVRDFNAKLIDHLTVAAKTFKPGQLTDVNATYFLKIQKDKLALVGRDR